MASAPEISVVVSSYQRPRHLERCLLSLASQTRVTAIEVIVSDDGSTDDTPTVVERFARVAPFPLRFITHEHDGFQLSRVRNSGARSATAPYLLFTDGDCVLPPHFVAIHLAARRSGVARAGQCYWLDGPTSSRLDAAAIRTAVYLKWISVSERLRLLTCAAKAKLYEAVHHAYRPKLRGNNFAVWRSDYERVNGFDETFIGWGCEDDDFRVRLRNAGVRIRSAPLGATVFHLWHPSDPTAGNDWKSGPNVGRLVRHTRLTRCLSGLVQRRLDEVAVRFVNEDRAIESTQGIQVCGVDESCDAPEVEVLVFPGHGQFTRAADCRVLLLTDDTAAPAQILRRADLVFRMPSELSLHGEAVTELRRAIAAAA